MRGAAQRTLRLGAAFRALRLGAAAALLVAACGPSARELCEAERALTCERMHACTGPATRDADFERLWGADPAACEALVEAGRTVVTEHYTLVLPPMDCAGRTARNACPEDASVYSLEAAELCLEDLEALACGAWLDWRPATGLDRPVSCEGVCAAE